MNIWVIITLVIGGTLLTASLLLLFLYKKKWKKTGNWESSAFLPLNKFNKNHKKHIVDTKKIKQSFDPNSPTFQGKFNCGFLLASGKSRKIPRIPLLKDNHFKPIKFGKEYNIKAYLLPKAHIVCFGGTGSGKTDTVLIPNILLNAMSLQQPSGLVFDPKGEIYEKTAPFLRAQGYKVININLSESANSDRWSPFQFAIDSGTEYIKYAFINSLLVEGGQIKQEVDAWQKTKSSEAKTSINETASILIKMSDKESSIWTNTAIDLLSIAGNSLFGYLSMNAFKKIKELDEYQDVQITSTNFEEMKEKIFKDPQINQIIHKNLKCLTSKNISNIIGTTSQQDWIKFAYSQGWHDKIGTFNATADQFKSYLMNIANALSFLGGEDFEDFISTSDFSYQDLIDQHTIIFINIPASAEKRKAIATLMVQQIWAFLELKSKQYKGGCLPIPFYFYFEELANVPEIQCFKQILTLGRGMGIFAFAVVQTLQQFEDLYGKGATNIVWSNTMAQIYLLAKDNETRDFISKQAGEVELTKNDGSKILRPLLDQEKLAQIKEGECVVMESRKAPIWLNVASSSAYKLINEWERNNLLENKLKKYWFDFGNKRIKNKYANDLIEIKKKLNKKFTPKSDVALMPNIINIFNNQEQINYEVILLTELVNKILINNDNEVLNEIKNEIINKCIFLLTEANEVNKESTDTDNEDKLEKSLDTQILEKFIEVLNNYFDIYIHCLKEKMLMNNKNAQLEKALVLVDCLVAYAKILQQNIIQFPYMVEKNNSMGLPTIGNLINTTIADLITNANDVRQKIKIHLMKIDFIENFVKTKFKTQQIEQTIANDILDKTNEAMANELKDMENKKIDSITTTIQNFFHNQAANEAEQIKIVKQEDQLNNLQEFQGDNFEFYIHNKLLIYKRIIIDYFISKQKNPAVDFNTYVKKFPKYNLIQEFNDQDFKKYQFGENLLVSIKKVLRQEENILEKYKKQQNIKFAELDAKYDKQKIDGEDQTIYLIEKLKEWLASI